MTRIPRWCRGPLTGTLSLFVLMAAGSATPAPTAAAAVVVPRSHDRPDLTACAGLGVAAECGELTVPLDRSDPAAGTTRVAFALIRRRDTALPAQGTVFYNPGGPGETVVEQASSLASMFGPLLDRRDLLLVDLRGSGESQPLSCPRLTAALEFGPDPALAAAVGDCGRSLGPARADYGADAMAADLDDVRAALGIDRLDLWGESYGSYLSQVYAARYPSRVRSLVLSGPLPIDFGPWGVAQAAAARNAIDLVCARSGDACRASTVLAGIQRLGRQLDRRPVRFSARLGGRGFPTVLDQQALAGVVYAAGGSPDLYGRLPAAVTGGLAGDYAPLEQLVTEADAGGAYLLNGGPAADQLLNKTLELAATCKDYPRGYSYAQPVAARAAAYRRGLDAQDPAAFYPVTAAAWSRSGADVAADCVDWPDERTSPSPLPPGTRMPDVPTLVIAGDLDGMTPVAFGRQVAAEFPDSRLLTVPNIGHVPTQGDACAVDVGLEFVRTLSTGGRGCAGTGTPPPVTAPAPLTGAGLTPVPGHEPLAQRRAVGLVLATAADIENQSQILELWGSAAGLRGGDYVEQSDGSIVLRSARVVADATVDGAVTPDASGTGGSDTLTLTGPGVADGTLTVTLTAGNHGHAVGTLAGARVDLTF